MPPPGGIWGCSVDPPLRQRQTPGHPHTDRLAQPQPHMNREGPNTTAHHDQKEALGVTRGQRGKLEKASGVREGNGHRTRGASPSGRGCPVGSMGGGHSSGPERLSGGGRRMEEGQGAVGFGFTPTTWWREIDLLSPKMSPVGSGCTPVPSSACRLPKTLLPGSQFLLKHTGRCNSACSFSQRKVTPAPLHGGLQPISLSFPSSFPRPHS